MELETLTERQREVYLFIEDKIQNRGYGPTVREICEEFDIKSPNGVVCHLKALEKKGLIRRRPKQSRAIELVNHNRNESNHDGHSRGFSSWSGNGELKELMDLPEGKVVRVDNDSLSHLHIVNGDYVIVQPTAESVSDNVVLVKSDDGTQSLRYVDGESVLESEEVVGVVAGVVRSLLEVSASHQ